jgi:FG-GAP-like repeat
MLISLCATAGLIWSSDTLGATPVSVAVSPATASISTGYAGQQFTAIERFSDGTTADVTTSAQWGSSDNNCAKATLHGGLVTGVLGIGTSCAATVVVYVGTLSATAQVNVKPLFAPTTFLPSKPVYEPQSVAFGDFNGDGIPDLVTTGSLGTLAIALGAGSGTFAAATTVPGTFYGPVVTGDFNGDGKLDLVLVSPPNIVLLLGDGAGGFGTPLSFAAGISSGANVGVAAGDFNGDGKPDLVATNYATNSVSVLLGDGTGSFAAATSFFAAATTDTGAGPQFVAIGDFNGDGKADLIVANTYRSRVCVLLGDGTGSFAAPSCFVTTLGDDPVSLAIADYNGDGVSDLAVAQGDRVPIFLGTGTGSFVSSGSFYAGAAESIVVADFNGDGIPDLAVSGIGSPSLTTGTAYILLGSGTGSFSDPIYLNVGNSSNFPLAVATADLSGDGKPDLVVIDPTPKGTLSILLHN